jgi:lipid II:glycine glycyltransferase (peptidoglycan interpeptide bridge formation enzyme)
LINFITHNNIDKQKWNACISACNTPIIYAQSWYLDVVAPSWNALVLNDYEAVMPLPTARKIFSVVYQPFFTQQLGVFGKAKASDFIAAIPKKYRYVNVCLNENNSDVSGQYTLTPRTNFVLSLSSAYNELFAAYSSHCSRHVKKAMKQQLSVFDVNNDEVVDFYVKEKGEATAPVTSSDYIRLKQLFSVINKHATLLSYQIKHPNGQVMAMAVFSVFKNRITYHLGAANEHGRKAGALYFLFDTVIKQNAGTNLLLDFEGSDISGIARFFEGFGAENRPYYRLVINKLPWPLSVLKRDK